MSTLYAVHLFVVGRCLHSKAGHRPCDCPISCALSRYMIGMPLPVIVHGCRTVDVRDEGTLQTCIVRFDSVHYQLFSGRSV